MSRLNMYQISHTALVNTIKKINQDHPIVTPVLTDEHKFFLKYFPVNSWGDQGWSYAPIRTPQPLKSFYYPPLQSVAVYPDTIEKFGEEPAKVILGTKSCDLQALKIIDKVYREGEYPDPYYVKAREKYIIISNDCQDAGEFCSCTLMNCQPYPTDDFDLNLSSLSEDNLLIEVGSERGEIFLKKYFSEVIQATGSHKKTREKNRAAITKKVNEINQPYHFHETHQQSIEKHLNSKEWQDLAKTCVECGTCTQICPTCHCFLLVDQPHQEKFERIKVWDSCFFAGYSRMAGGLTPRLSLADRFKNRFYHKFDSFVTNFQVEACTGCGRCSEGCMGDIDLRKVLLELEKRVVLKEKINLV